MSNKNIIQIFVDIQDALNSIKNISTNLNNFITQATQPIRVSLDGTAITQGVKDIHTQIKNTSEQFQKDITRSLGDLGFMLNTINTGFQMIGGSISPLIAASNQQETATNSLKAALTTLKQATDGNIKSYQQFATLMQNTANVGDEVVLGMLSLATSMGIVENKRKDAVKGAIGLSKAYGIDLQTALKGIALAYEGEYSLLSRQLPALRAAQTETEKLAVLQKAMADGFDIASAQAKTGAGAIEQLKNQFSDLQETLGDLVKGTLRPFVEWLNTVFSILNKHRGVVIGIGIVMALLTTAIIANTIALKTGIIQKYKDIMASGVVAVANSAVTVSTVSMTTAIWASVKAIAAQSAVLFANPIGWAVVGIGLLTTALGFGTQALIKWGSKAGEWNIETKRMADVSTETTNTILSNSNKIVIACNEELAAQEGSYSKTKETILHTFELENNLTMRQRERGVISLNEYTDRCIKLRQKRDKDLEWLAERHEIIKDGIRKKHSIAFVADLEAITNTWLSTYEQIELKAKEQLKEFEPIKILNPDLYAEAEIAINKVKNREIQKQRLQDYKDSVEIARMKDELLEGNHNHYKTAVMNYYNWVKDKYGEDTREYLDALRMKVDLTKQALADMQAIQKRLQNQSKEDALKEQYENDKKTLELMKDQNKTHNADMIALEEEYQNALKELKQKEDADAKRTKDEENARGKQEKEDILTLAEKRLEIGKKGQAQLKQAADDYLQYCKATYGEDSIEFYDAQQRRQQAYETANESMKSGLLSLSEAYDKALNSMRDACGLFGDAVAGTFSSLVDGMSGMLSQMIVEHKSFQKVLDGIWKNMIRTMLDELNKLIVRWLFFDSLRAVASPIGGILGAASGGYITGPGTATSDSIPARLSNGEYVINAAKTRLFKPLLDVINYSPIPAIKKMFNDYAATIHLPLTAYNLPLTTPRFAYASGGLVTGGMPPFDAMNERLDQVINSIEHLTTQTTNQMERLNQKDYNVNVTTKFKGVEFAREMVKAQKEYMEIHK